MLKLLRQILEEVTAVEDFRLALNLVVKRVVEALDTEACSIFLYDESKEAFVLMATEGLSQDAVGKAHVPLGQGLISKVAEKERPLNLINASEHPDYYVIPGVGEQNYDAYLAVPIQFRRRVLGTIVVEHSGNTPYTAAEEAFLLTLATQLAVLIAQAEGKGLLVFTDEAVPTLPEVLRGIPSASGVAIGEIRVVYPRSDLEVVPVQQSKNPERELELFEDALEQTRNEVRILSKRMSKNVSEEEQSLFEAYIKMLDSKTLIEAVRTMITDEKLTAQSSVAQVFLDHVRQFLSMDNQYMQDRAADVEDLGRRLLAHLQEDDEESSTVYPDDTILISNEIFPGNLAEVPQGQLVAVVSGSGSVNSHVAILARALGVPSVMGVSDIPLSKLNGVKAIVDGYLGQIYLNPNKETLAEFEALAKEEQELDEDLEPLQDLPAETEDGHRISLYVNTGLMADVGRAITAGAEGIGLYRTEVPFMTRDRFPSSDEQMVIYRQLLGVFAPRPVIIRSLDIGGDKSLPYFPIKEDNPFLGWRGIRVLLEHPEIFLTQIRAMLRANEGYNNLKIMLPMITDLLEVEEATHLIKKTYDELVKEEGLDIKMPEIGIMVEVPSAAYEARNLAQRVDFLSVGSNDLTQYILAVDRNNPRVAHLYDALHPAVLKALKHIVDGAHEEGKSVSICGEMASDPMATVLLLAMGFDILSLNAPVLSRVKWVIRKFTMSRARKLLSDVLVMKSAGEIRRYIEFALEEEGLGGLIRAGRH